MSLRPNELDIPQGLDPQARRLIEEVRASSGPPLHEMPIERSYAATRYVHERVDTLKIDSSRMVIVGDSCCAGPWKRS